MPRANGARSKHVVWWLPDDSPHSRWGSLASTLPNIAYRCRTAGMRRMLRKLLRRDAWDGIVFDGISAGWALPAVLDHYAGRSDRPRLIYVSHNHEGSVRSQIAESQPLFLKRQAVRLDALKVSRLERELVDAVDFVTAITHEDMALYRRERSDKAMDVLTPGYCGRRVDERRISPALPRRAVIVGSFDWIAKRMNLAEFVDVADPLFADAGAELQAVGSGDEAFLQQLRQQYLATHFTGTVPDIGPYLDQARIAIVPERRRRLQAQGAGVCLQPRAGVRARGLLRRRAVAPQRQRHAVCRPRRPRPRRARGDRRRGPAEPPAGAGVGRLRRQFRLVEPRPSDRLGDRQPMTSPHDLSTRGFPSPTAAPRRLDFIDQVLVVIFLLGLYLGVSLAVSEKVPLTCAPSGFAGLIMLWRRRDQIVPKHLAGLLLVVTVYLCSVLAASDYSFLGKRFNGLLQLTYSLVIAYAMFLTLLQGDRRQIARILLAFCFAIIIGCLLERYAGLRRVSDAVRERLYQMDQVYDADLRDQVLYGRVRPKLFTSEPSAVTFAYTHFSSVWLVISPWRHKLLA